PPNETVAHLGKSTGYDAALPDLEAALVWAKRTHPGVPVYVLGSSYSAALVFVLAAKHPHDVAAVMAFSPNEYLDNKQTVRTAAHQLRMPVFIDSAPDKDEVNAARMIYDVVPGTHKVQYVPANGVHGASTLREDRDPSGEQANWDALSAFLRMVRALPPA
ncbi:MAG TPA: alpha/beta hydrolase, partial [Candidatus Baltobacteraceae bacterium]|nr:alpha/beta hydrolase [Candidatus Baltobacteraceae bacterium]